METKEQRFSNIVEDLTIRMSMDIVTISLVNVVCHAVGWPMWIAVAVSLWALVDLVVVLAGKKKFHLPGMCLSVCQSI